MHDFRGVQKQWRCHWSDEIQKKDVFFRKIVLRVFGAPGCHASTLIDFANTALARKSSVKPICMISEGYRTHGGVTGPMNIKKKDVFFFGKSCSRVFGTPGCNPCTLIDLANTALASRVPVKPICMISEGYRTNRGVTAPMKFKKSGRFVSENLAPGFSGLLVAIQHLN